MRQLRFAPLPRPPHQNSQQRLRVDVISERSTEVDVQIAIAGSEDEACSELERIFPVPVLAVSAALGASPRFRVLLAQEMKQVRGFQFRGAVSGAFGIDQEREGDAGFLAKQARVVHVAEADCRQRGSGLFELAFLFAQLRDMLAAEDSTVVPQKNYHGGILLPKRAETNLTSTCFRQNDVRQPRAESVRHKPILFGCFPLRGNTTHSAFPSHIETQHL